MEQTNACVLEEVPLFNVLSVIEGKALNDVGEYTDTIAICGNQPDLIRNALEMNVNCLIL